MPTAAKRLPRPLVDFHVHLFPDRLYDAVFRDNGLRLIRECSYTRP